MDRAYSTNVRNAYKNLVGRPEEEDQLRYVYIGATIILKQILKK